MFSFICLGHVSDHDIWRSQTEKLRENKPIGSNNFEQTPTFRKIFEGQWQNQQCVNSAQHRANNNIGGVPSGLFGNDSQLIGFAAKLSPSYLLGSQQLLVTIDKAFLLNFPTKLLFNGFVRVLTHFSRCFMILQ